MRVLIALAMLFLLNSGCGRKETQLDWAELRPILGRLNLTTTTHQSENYRRTWELEEADAKAYGPVSGVTLFLKAAPPSKDREAASLSKDRGASASYAYARYWIRVEDYSTAEAALKRATEYWAPGETYKRLDEIPLVGKHPEKDTLRLWAVARGKRVYALTTDTYAFMLNSFPGELKAAISKLPEK